MDKNIKSDSQKSTDELISVLDSKFFKVLSEPVRIEILKFLICNGRSDISTIEKHFSQDRSVISRHLRRMSDMNMLICEKESSSVYYVVNGPMFINTFEGIVNNIKIVMRQYPDCS